jgi:hypothetical protein
VPNWDNSFVGDFRVADGWQLVGLLVQQSDGTYAAAVEPIFAIREPSNKRTAAGLMEAADAVFHLDATAGEDPAVVAAEQVRPGDRIEDEDGVLWSVMSATLEGAEDQWRCACLKVPV